jgi:hypothetical protein
MLVLKSVRTLERSPVSSFRILRLLIPAFILAFEEMVNGKIRTENLRVDLITNCQEYLILETKPCQGIVKNFGSLSLILDKYL